MASVPSVRLCNNANFPLLGFGTWKANPGVLGEVLKNVIAAGYRHIDCAQVYGNEKEIGDALKELMDQNVVKRQELFITSKLWNTMHNPEDVPSGIQKTLKDLRLGYVDLYLMHWPTAFAKSESGETFPRTPDGKIKHAYVDYIDTWRAMEKLVDNGLVKAIGLSNFNSQQIGRIHDNCRIKPAVLQIECHPYLNQSPLISLAKDKGMAITAYCPLGSKDRPWAKPGDPELLQDETVNEIARKYNKSAAQILIRFHIDRGVAVIPKSVNESRIKQNAAVLDFELSNTDMEKLLSISVKFRYCNPTIIIDGKPVPRDADHPYYPFKEPF